MSGVKSACKGPAEVRSAGRTALRLLRGYRPVLDGDRRSACPPVQRQAAAFTLIELMVVMLIIGVLAGIAVPAMKGLGQANRTSAAHRQILDDLGIARLRAINDRTTVYMVFVPTNVAQAFARASTAAQNQFGRAERNRLTNLLGSQFAAYALIEERSVGDQPGRHTRRYISEWRTLPEGMLFGPYKLYNTAPGAANEYVRTFSTAMPTTLQLLPFPMSRSEPFPLPYIAFDSQGRLLSQRDEIIPLARGSVFAAKLPNGNYSMAAPDWQLTPPPKYGASPASQTNTFKEDFKASQVQRISQNPVIDVLAVPVKGPSWWAIPVGSVTVNPWLYVSTNPTNNADRYDLWTEAVVGGKVVRFSNWERDPTVVQ